MRLKSTQTETSVNKTGIYRWFISRHMNVCYSMDLSKSTIFFTPHKQNRCQYKKKVLVCEMSVFIQTIWANISPYAAQSRSHCLYYRMDFIRCGLVCSYFHLNPFNNIILLTGINCLHISTLDTILFLFWMKVGCCSPYDECCMLTLCMDVSNKIVDKEKCWIEIILRCVNVGWSPFSNFYGIYITHLNAPNNGTKCANRQFSCVRENTEKKERETKYMIWHNQRLDEDNNKYRIRINVRTKHA